MLLETKRNLSWKGPLEVTQSSCPLCWAKKFWSDTEDLIQWRCRHFQGTDFTTSLDKCFSAASFWLWRFFFLYPANFSLIAIHGCSHFLFCCAPLRGGSFFFTTHCSRRLQFLSCPSLVVSSLGYSKKFLLRWSMLQPQWYKCSSVGLSTVCQCLICWTPCYRCDPASTD